MKKRFIKNENAEVMVEASLILSVAVIIIFMLIYLGLIMYHQTLITSTANITASNIAQVYSNKYKDPISGYVDVSNLDKEGLVNKMKNEDYAKTIAKKGEWYSKYKMAKGQILKADDPKVDVKIENKNGALLRAQVVVDVQESYELPIVKFFGIDNPVIEYQAEGRADCFEIMDYVNIIEAADKIDVTENYKVTFHKSDNFDDKSVYKVVEVMHDMSIADTMKLSSAEQTRFPADLEKDGERFYRWRTRTGDTFTKYTVVTGNIDVYPEYEVKVYFDANGGSVNPNMKYVPKGHAIGNMPTPSKANYAFDGWFTNKSGGTRYYSTTIINAETTLYAHWHCTHPSTRVEDSGVICQGTGKRKTICNICGALLKEENLFGDHDKHPCDKPHSIHYSMPDCEKPPYVGHTYKYGYSYTSVGRHIICRYCGKVFPGYYCAEHYTVNGKRETDNWWTQFSTVKCPY